MYKFATNIQSNEGLFSRFGENFGKIFDFLPILTKIFENMSEYLVTIIFAIGALAIFVVGLSLTLIFKGHHIESEISTNKDMKRLGIKCAVQETREDMAGDCDDDAICTGNCAGCDVDHETAKKH